MALIDKLRAIGNAIREKNGTTDLIPLADMPQAILDIKNGDSKPQLKADSSLVSVVLPVYIPTATAELKGSNLSARAGEYIGNYTASIEGESTSGSVLSVSSTDFDVSECSHQWYKGTLAQMTKYSHTSNWVDGVRTGDYNSSAAQTEVITIEGATSLEVTIKWGTESLSYDWVCVYAGNYPSYTASSSGYIKKLGGADGEETFTVEGNSVTFAFRSDGGGVGSGYGYFAAVSGVGLDWQPVSEETTYTVVGEENKIYCELQGTGDLIGMVNTEQISIGA